MEYEAKAILKKATQGGYVLGGPEDICIGESIILKLDDGHKVRTTPVMEYMENPTNVLIRTVNSEYRVSYRSPRYRKEGDSDLETVRMLPNLTQEQSDLVNRFIKRMLEPLTR